MILVIPEPIHTLRSDNVVYRVVHSDVAQLAEVSAIGLVIQVTCQRILIDPAA